MATVGLLREQVMNAEVEFCTIVNARSSRRSEDGAFCAQSARHHIQVEVYPLVGEDEIVSRGRTAARTGATRFDIVTSGRDCPSGVELEVIGARPACTPRALSPRVSPWGCSSPSRRANWPRPGCARHYHRNLEAGLSFLPRICYQPQLPEARVDSVQVAQEAVPEVCVGGPIVELGESPCERAELATGRLRTVPAERVPLNFLNPIPGTPLESIPRLTPSQALAAVVAFRLLNPRRPHSHLRWP